MRHILARLNGVCNLNGFLWLPTGPLFISLAHETDHHLVVIDHYATVTKDRSADIFYGLETCSFITSYFSDWFSVLNRLRFVKCT